MTINYVEITDPDSGEVAQFHDILVEAFPDPYGREDVDILRRNLQQGSWTNEDEICRYHLIVARKGSRVVGGTSFYFFSHKVLGRELVPAYAGRVWRSQRATGFWVGKSGFAKQRATGFWVGKSGFAKQRATKVSWMTNLWSLAGKVEHAASLLLTGDRDLCSAISSLGIGSYLAVKGRFRGEGIGTKLITIRDQTLARDAREFNCPLKGLIIQVSDPGLMSVEEIEQDSMDPWEREEFWKKREYRKIAFDFIQPPIREGEPPVEYLSLYMFPYCSEWKKMKLLSRSELQDIIYCFIRCTGTPGPPETDPSCIRMRSELAKSEHFQLL